MSRVPGERRADGRQRITCSDERAMLAAARVANELVSVSSGRLGSDTSHCWLFRIGGN